MSARTCATGLLALALAGCSSGTRSSSSPALLVCCGAANRPPIEEIATLFEKETGIAVETVFGSSGALLAQLELTGRGDVYIPASPDYLAIGERKGLLLPEPHRIAAYLVPAILTPAGNPASIRCLADLARPGVRVAIGNPETVCPGLFAVEIFERSGLLPAVMSNVVAFATSCPKLANLAVLARVDAILGWRVVEKWNPEELSCVLIEPRHIPRLAYVPVAVPASARHVDTSRRFAEFVVSSAGQAVYEKHGYLTSEAEARRYAPDAVVGGEYELPPVYFELLHEPAL